MTNEQLLALCEESQNLVDELNNLDFTKKEESMAFDQALAQLENLEGVLSGEPSAIIERKMKGSSQHLKH